MMIEINKELAEETGIHVGDGSMNIYNAGAYYTVACHHEDDKEYMLKVVLPLIKKVYNKTPKPREWSKGTYGFRICSKELVKFKNEILGLPLGKKTNISIPKPIKENEDLMKSFLKGLFDTDGSLTLWRTNNKLYPRIYFSNVSKKLVEQVKEFLTKQGFKATYWQTKYKQKNWNDSHRISINGEKMLVKWLREIGFNNQKHLRKLNKLEINQNFYK